MKKIIQNILAENSNNEIAYLCGKCGNEVEKEASVCKYCGAKLGNIRCPFCNFNGTIEDFKYDTCPKCGRKKSSYQDSTGIKKNSISISKTSLSVRLFWLLFSLLILIIVGLLAIFVYNFDLF